MPDPQLYIIVLLTTASVSAFTVLTLAWLSKSLHCVGRPWFGTTGMMLGLLNGFLLLHPGIEWPPVNAMGRFLLLVLPVTILVEWVGAVRKSPVWLIWSGRLLVALGCGRVLLHHSVYLSGARPEWTAVQSFLILAASGLFLAGEWCLLIFLARRCPQVGIPVILAMTIQAAGIVIMLMGLS